MSILKRRFKKEVPELEITAFLNLMVALVPFLLVTAVFTQVKVLELNLPPPGAGASVDQKDIPYQIQLVVRATGIEVGDNRGGLIKRIENKGDSYDYAALNQVLRQVKQRFPDKTDIMILAEPEISYNVLIQTMDSTRLYETTQAGSLVQAELFPDISIGDAPAGTGK